MKDKEYPDIIKEIGFDFKWDNKKVWALKYPVEEMDIEKLTWHFDVPFHWHGNEIYNLRPIETINNPGKYKEEYEITMKSDLKYPIDVTNVKTRS